MFTFFKVFFVIFFVVETSEIWVEGILFWGVRGQLQMSKGSIFDLKIQYLHSFQEICLKRCLQMLSRSN